MYSKTYYTCTDKNDWLLLCTIYMIKEPLCISYISHLATHVSVCVWFSADTSTVTNKISFRMFSHLDIGLLWNIIVTYIAIYTTRNVWISCKYWNSKTCTHVMPNTHIIWYIDTSMFVDLISKKLSNIF